MTGKNKRVFIVIFMLALCSAFAFLTACGGEKSSGSGESAKSAYRQYIEKYPDYEGTEEQWLRDLLGGKLGGDTPTEKSVYELYREAYPDYEGTEEEWLKDLLEGRLNAKDPETKTYTVSFLYDESDEEPWAQITVEDGDTPVFPGSPDSVKSPRKDDSQ